MPIVVAGAGAALGAWGAGALMKKMGENIPSVPIRVDDSQAMDYLNASTQATSFYDQLGLGLYSEQLTNAKADVIKGYQDSISTLTPQSQSSNAAVNEMMKFMGMDPIQATAGYNARLQGMGLAGDTSNIQSLITQANNEKDPAQRAVLKAQVANALQQAPVQDNTAAALAGIGPMPTYAYAGIKNATDAKTVANPAIVSNASAVAANLNSVAPGSGDAFLAQQAALPATVVSGGKPIVDAGPNPQMQVETASSHGKLVNQTDEVTRQQMIDQANYDYQSELADWKNQQAKVTAQEAAATADRTSAKNNFLADFQDNYTPNYDAAYTGDEVTKQIQATPGYQQQVNSGTQAIERQGAAQGMLGSGNTLTALQAYGQQLGNTYFQSHLQNLATIAGIGAPATQAIAANQASEGTSLASLDNSLGSADMSTFQNIGATMSGNLNTAANVAYQTATYDANRTQDLINAQDKNKNAALQATPGLMNANTAAGVANYQMAQNQQGGQAYFS